MHNWSLTWRLNWRLIQSVEKHLWIVAKVENILFTRGDSFSHLKAPWNIVKIGVHWDA